MIYLKWLALALIDYVLLLTVPFAAPVIAAFTKAQPYDLRPYTWGGWWGTWDNPPQGDAGYVEKRCPFPIQISGWRGYINRVVWMIRNPLYGFAKRAGVEWREGMSITHIGNPHISDKYEIPGWYFARCTYGGKLVAFEFYCVLPWLFGRCLRARLGWKISTDKFQRYGFAQLVNTCNPFDGYGQNK